MRISSRWWLILLTLALVLLSVASQRKTWGVFFVDDSIAFPINIASAQKGTMDWAELLLMAGNGHYHPLWTLLFSAQLETVGFEPIAWHITHAVYHGLSAALVVVLVRAWTGTWTAPLATGLLWASVVVGGYDDVAMTIFEAHYPLGLLGWLATLVCFAQIRAATRTRWGWLVAICASLAVLTWNVIWLGLPALALQYLFFRPKDPQDDRAQRHVLKQLGILFVLLGFVLFQVFSITGAGAGAFGIQPSRLLEVPRLLAEALARLFVTDPTEAPVPLLTGQILILWIALMGTLRRTDASIAAVLSILPLGVLSIVAVVRPMSEIPDADYLYLPTFWWCVVVGLVVESTVRRTGSIVALFLWIPLFVGVIGHQQAKAENTVRLFGPRMREVEQRYDDHIEVLAHLDREARERSRPVVVANMPIPLQPALSMPIPLSALVRWQKAVAEPQIEVRGPDEVTADDLAELREILARSPAPAARQWECMLRDVVPEIAALAKGSHLLETQRKVARIRQRLLLYPECQVSVGMSDLVRLMDHRAVGIEVAFPNEPAPEDDLSEFASKVGNELAEMPGWKSFLDRAGRAQLDVMSDMIAWKNVLDQSTGGWIVMASSGCDADLVRRFDQSDFARVERIRTRGVSPSSLQLVRQTFRLEAGHTYELRGRLRAERDRSVSMVVSGRDSAETHQLLSQSFRVGPTAVERSWRFTPSTPTEVSLQLLVGDSDVPLEVDYLRLYDDDREITHQ